MGIVVEQGEVAHHGGQGSLEIVGQKGDQILPALFHRFGTGLPGLKLLPDGVEVLLQGSELLGKGDLLVGEIGDPGRGGADLVQPAGKASHGQIKSHKHQ